MCTVIFIVLGDSCILRSYSLLLFFFTIKFGAVNLLQINFFVAEAIRETQREKYERRERNNRARGVN